jgi:hypothetical protein
MAFASSRTSCFRVSKRETAIDTENHGYYYRMLPVAAGFGVVAFPADYRASGITTFLVNQNGVIYQKDLCDKTADIAE